MNIVCEPSLLQLLIEQEKSKLQALSLLAWICNRLETTTDKPSLEVEIQHKLIVIKSH